MKKTISAEIIADSLSPRGERCTTYILTFPRIILAELNTHRMLSKNSASSRAIPFEKMVNNCLNDPFIPIAFQKDHSGMQGTEYFNEEQYNMLKDVWLEGRDAAVTAATNMQFGIGVREENKPDSNISVTKQICNRQLEAYMWHTAIVTATEFENFFKLRCPQYRFFVDGEAKDFRSRRDALEACPDLIDTGIHSKPMDEMDWLVSNQGAGEIHIMALAEAMWDAMNQSSPKQLGEGEWHIPFGERMDEDRIWKMIETEKGYSKPTGPDADRGISLDVQEIMVKIATARCARVSYENYEGGDDYKKDIILHDRLSTMGHWSPFEHCAKAMRNSEMSGNFKGFIQYRKTFHGESGVK